MNNDRILNIEDIENSIEIFGIKFDMEFSEEYIEKLKKIDIKDIEKDDNVFKQLKIMMNIILNDENAYNKICEEYKKQKNKELGIQGFVKVFEFIFKEYSKEFNNIEINKIDVNIPEVKNYRKNYNNYRNYEKNYRKSYRRKR